MTDELTMFGRPMDDLSAQYDGSPVWELKMGKRHWVRIFEERFWLKPREQRFAWSSTVWDPRMLVGMETPELARDDAEQILRALHEALSEVAEPWNYDGHPDEEIDCEVAYVGADGPEITLDRWSLSGQCWLISDELFGERHVYAWRPMPKAPRSDP